MWQGSRTLLSRTRDKLEGSSMQRRYATSAPSYTDISEILHAWHTAVAVGHASQEADLYACVVVLIMESLDHYSTVADLIKAYCAPDIGLKSRVLALCGDGEIHLQPQVVLGAACALRFRQLMEAAIA
jgi:hypothetical protein